VNRVFANGTRPQHLGSDTLGVRPVYASKDRAKSDFARTYEKHVWRVYGFLAYRLRDREAAEDLTQVTFERALRAWSRFDPRRASESTWLIAIARNLLIDHHRRDHSNRFEPFDERLSPAVSGPEERFTTSPELIEALAQLSERDREVVALRFGGDLTGPEIAELMKLSLSNIQQILSRSLKKLRVLLEAENMREADMARPARRA
jgi:RNA polymerase sigma factor (sigma-70 family)